MADGFSCKEQIAQQTNRNALHLAEVLQMGLRQGSESRMYPERRFVEQRKKAQKRSMVRAGVALAGILAAAGAGLLWARKRA
jgi:hypothetical protein